MTDDLTRRQFIRVGATVMGAIASNGKAWGAAAGRLDRAFEHGDPLHQFQYNQVQFQPGLHQKQLEQTHHILMGMDEDSLLRPFRLAAGLPVPGLDMGGWYSNIGPTAKGGADGPATFGQWISALSRYYAATGDEATRLKVQRLVEGYAKALEPEGKIFQLSGGPTYHYDKLVCGLEDAYEFAGVKSALNLISAVTQAARPYLAGRAIDPLGPGGEKSSESYTVPENQFIAWQRGADQSQLDMARQYLADDFYFEPLARSLNVLPGRHAYSHVNALCSAAKAYLVLGEDKYLKAAINGLAFVEQQSWATGGWGPSEVFLPQPPFDVKDPDTGEVKHIPAVESLADALFNQRNHFETPCGAYAHFKLTRYLLRITQDPRYGDSMERIMYNTVLGALPLQPLGRAFYYSNYHSHAHKGYFAEEWPCCSGTLPQIAADYRISTYFRDKNGVFVNLYIPSTLRWRQDDTEISLTQSGRYPLADEIVFEVKAPKPKRFAIRLRIPAWTWSPSIRVNGKSISESIRTGAFASIRREWRSGDRIELQLPRRLGLKAVDDKHTNMVALVHGPLVLFAISDDTPAVTREQLLATRQQGDGIPEWRTELDKGLLRFVPFWAIGDETYFTYLTV